MLIKNNVVENNTIEGPNGVSKNIDIIIPPVTDIHPINIEINTILSGEFAYRLAVAEGIISIDVINKAPTIFMEILITNDIKITKINLIRLTFTP